MGQRLVVRHFGKRVIEDLIETLCGELLCNLTTQFFGIRLETICKAGVQFLRELDIVIAVDTEDVFHHIALTLYVHAVARYFQLPGVAKLGDYVDFKGFEDRFDGVLTDGFADKRVDAIDVNSNRPRLEKLRSGGMV